MSMLTAVRRGFLAGRGKALCGLLFYGAALFSSTLMVAPLKAGLDGALSRSPEAGALVKGRGLDLLAELGFRQAAMWKGGLSLVVLGLAVQFLIVLYLTAGAYAVAADDRQGPWKAFWPGAWRNTVPFGILFVLNTLSWVALSLAPVLAVFAVGHALRDATDPGPVFKLFWVEAAALLVLANLMRNSMGFAQARYVLTRGGEDLGRCFLRALVFTFRRFVPVNALTWGVNALRAAVMGLAVYLLSPGYATGGRAFVTALVVQAAFAAMAFLRVAEIRSQVAYMGAFVGTPEGEARPAPADEQAPGRIGPETSMPTAP